MALRCFQKDEILNCDGYTFSVLRIACGFGWVFVFCMDENANY